LVVTELVLACSCFMIVPFLGVDSVITKVSSAIQYLIFGLVLFISSNVVEGTIFVGTEECHVYLSPRYSSPSIGVDATSPFRFMIGSLPVVFKSPVNRTCCRHYHVAPVQDYASIPRQRHFQFGSTLISVWYARACGR